MDWDPLLYAGMAIPSHAITALAALVLGGVQLIAPKGTNTHRVIGYGWCALMLYVAVSSFWIQTIGQYRGFSWIHLLSVLTVFSVPLAVVYARHGAINAHRRVMVMLFWLALVVTGLFTLLPGRIMHAVVFG